PAAARAAMLQSAERDVGVLSTTGIRPDIAPARAYDYMGSAPVHLDNMRPGGTEPERKVPADVGVRPVVRGTEGVRADHTTLDDSLAAGAGKEDAIRSGVIPVLPGTTIYQPEPAPMTIGKRILAAAKGAALGSLVGTSRGLLSGNAMISSGFGMGEFKAAGRHVFEAFDANHDGRIDLEDANAGLQQIKVSLIKTREMLHAKLKGAERVIEEQ